MRISDWFHAYGREAITFSQLITRIRNLEEPYMKEEEGSVSSSTPYRRGAQAEETAQDQSHLIPA